MGQHWQAINPFARKLIAKQHLFFIATAPLSPDGHVNVSPKGHAPDTFAIINDNRVAFLDLTGSGVETIAHVRVSSAGNPNAAACALRHAATALIHTCVLLVPGIQPETL
jgi:hypothetical protein